MKVMKPATQLGVPAGSLTPHVPTTYTTPHSAHTRTLAARLWPGHGAHAMGKDSDPAIGMAVSCVLCMLAASEKKGAFPALLLGLRCMVSSWPLPGCPCGPKVVCAVRVVGAPWWCCFHTASVQWHVVCAPAASCPSQGALKVAAEISTESFDPPH